MIILKRNKIVFIISTIILYLSITFILVPITSISAGNNTKEIVLKSSTEIVEIGEEFKINISISNTNIAAYTLWVYYENEKLECLSKNDNLNILDNKIIYTWYSDIGEDKKLENILELDFLAKEEGIATFSVVGEMYNKQGEKIDFKSNSLDINIGKIEKNNVENEDEYELLTEVQNNSDSLNLAIMRTNNEEISPDFSADILEYYLIVDDTINNLNITAIPESTKAEVVISGNENLKKGLNIIKIKVSLNGKSKTYIINVTKTNNKKQANTNLETLAIEYYTLEPEYQANITNYQIEISNSDDAINILAVPEDENANVNITGNTDLKLGKNKVEVTVTASNGITKKKYNIEVYKRNEEEEKIYQEEIKNKIQQANELAEEKNTEKVSTNEIKETGIEEKQKSNNKIIGIVILVTILIVVGVIYIILKRKRNKK